jgi:hypothetical protein
VLNAVHRLALSQVTYETDLSEGSSVYFAWGTTVSSYVQLVQGLQPGKNIIFTSVLSLSSILIAYEPHCLCHILCTDEATFTRSGVNSCKQSPQHTGMGTAESSCYLMLFIQKKFQHQYLG